MPSTDYGDIFATKGIEYLLVIGFLALLVVFWRILNPLPRTVPVVTALRRGIGAASSWFQLPLERFYHPAHTWAAVGADGLITVGLDDFGQKLLGPAQRIELPAVGEHRHQGEPGPRVAVGSKSIDLLSPVQGTVVATNDAVLQSPALVNEDPYGGGWLLKMKPDRAGFDLKGLLHGDLARAWIELTESDLRQRISRELGQVLQDGGVPVSGIARSVAGESWDRLARDFLLS